MSRSLLLIDAHEALREGLGPLFDRTGDPDCAVVLYAGDADAVATELALAGSLYGIAVLAIEQRPSVLSKREGEVMELLSQGLTGEEMAQLLVLSIQTVKTHVRNAMVKLQASTRVHAIAIAIREGYITGGVLPPVIAGPQASGRATSTATAVSTAVSMTAA